MPEGNEELGGDSLHQTDLIGGSYKIRTFERQAIL